MRAACCCVDRLSWQRAAAHEANELRIENDQLRAEISNSPTEETVVERVPAAKVPAMIAEGTIDHALVVVALHYWLARPDESGLWSGA